MVLTVSFVLSLVIGLSCHHRRRIITASLISASRYQDHTTSPSARQRVRLSRNKRPPHPAANVRWRLAKRPSWPERDARKNASDLPVVTSKHAATN